jgi:hypothetical protein
MRLELPTAVSVDNYASVQPARSIYISRDKSVSLAELLLIGVTKNLFMIIFYKFILNDSIQFCYSWN